MRRSLKTAAIEFVAAAECKQEVSNFLVRLSAVAGRAFIAEVTSSTATFRNASAFCGLENLK